MEQVTATGLMSSKKFIPMISAKIPNIYKINGNATLKIDDVTWGHSNTGVWSRNLKEITDAMHYTDWKEYVGDTVIDVDTDE
jgi:galactose-1-phosphate uridylyltransferase